MNLCGGVPTRARQCSEKQHQAKVQEPSEPCQPCADSCEGQEALSEMGSLLSMLETIREMKAALKTLEAKFLSEMEGMKWVQR